MPANDPKRPDYRHPVLEAVAPDLQLLTDLLDGTRAMQAHAKSHDYLAQWGDESEETFRKRSRAATLFEGLGRTLSAAVGMMFQAPPAIEYKAQEALLTEQWDNIDGMGRKGDVFVKEAAQSSLRDGVGVVVVDHPSAPAGVTVTAANERDLGLRPRWAFYPRAAVLSWRTSIARSDLRIAQLVLYEPAEVEAGEFGTATVDRYRVLWVRDGVAGWTVYERPEAEEAEWPVVDEGVYRNRAGKTRDTLPIAIGYTGSVRGVLDVRPPLLGVAWANLEHWRNKTELQWGSRIAGIEQWVVKGALIGSDGQPGALRTGWEHAIQVEAGGDVKVEGPKGTGLGSLKERVAEAEKEIAALGLSFLSSDTRAQETAEAKRLDATAENSTLATAAQGIEDMVNLAWEHHGWFLGLETADCPVVRINRDFEATALSAPELTAIAALSREGMPKRLLLDVMVEKGFVKVNDEAEKDALALEWEGASDAAEEIQRLEREAAVPDQQAA